MSGHAPQGSDKAAAFTGLILGAVFIGAIMYVIVLWTNAQFAEHEGKKAAASVSVNLRVG